MMRKMFRMSFSCSTAVSSSKISTFGSSSSAFVSCTICRSAVRRLLTGTLSSMSHCRNSSSFLARASSFFQLMNPPRVS